MPSLRCRLFLFLLHHRHLFRLKLRRETGLDWATDLPGVRRSAERASKMLGRLPKGMEATPVTANGVRAEWIAPGGADPDRAILYFHGGGYVLGSIEAHRAIVAKFVKASGVRALSFGYRLAPEHPFPAALDDALAAYGWLLDSGLAPSRIAFAGDSGGGGLCLATLLALKDQGRPLPAAAAVLSPLTDLTFSGESLTTNAATCLAPTGSWLACRKHYAEGRDVTDPYISPLFGDLRGLPPLSIHAGGNETLRDDSTRFAAKAQAAGVPVALTVGEGLCHCYPACAPIFPEASRAMAAIGRFIAGHTGA
jgi:acetyl esterase/lipase